MRVLAVTPWFPTPSHPVSGVFTLRDAELLATDHEVTVLHLCRPDWLEPAPDRISGVRVERIPFAITKPGTFLAARRRMRGLLKEHDLLHTMAFPALLLAAVSGIRAPWVHTEHFSALVTPPANAVAAFGRRMLMRAFKRPGAVVAVSSSLADAIAPFREVPAHVIGNRVEFPQAGVLHRGGGSDELALVAVGGLVSRKGPLIAVEALKDLRDSGTAATLTWIGDGEERDAVVARVRELGLVDAVTLTGALAPELVSECLTASDVFVLPVETETFGVAIAEALAHGVPVVATGTGGHEEFLPARASRLVAQRESGAVARAVAELMSDPERWDATEVQAYAAQRFSEASRKEAYEATYREAVQRKR